MAFESVNPLDVPPFQLQQLIPLVWENEVPDSGYAQGAGPSSPTEVTCAQALGSEIYIGCSDGTLLRYALQATGPNSPESYVLLSRQTLPTNKKVQEMALCPSINRALILSDNQVHFYVIPSLDPIPSSIVRPLRNVLSLAVDEQFLRMQPFENAQKTGPVDFCVIKRANIGMYTLRERLVLQRDVPNSLNIRYGRRIGRYLCAADNENYDMIDLATATSFPLLPLSQVPEANSRTEPLVAPISDEEFLLLSNMGQTTMGVFITGNGDPVRGTLEWPSYPESICFEYPHVCALLGNKTIEIHSIETQAIVQVISPSNDLEPRMLSLSHAGYLVPSMQRSEKMKLVKLCLDDKLSRAESSELQARPPVFTRSNALIISNHSVQALVPATLFSQAEALLDSHRLEDLIELADQNQRRLLASNSPDDQLAAEELHYIYQRLGFQCLSETRFEDAGAHLLAGETDPRLLVYYFPDLRGNLLNSSSHIDVFDGVAGHLPRDHSIDDIVLANLVKNYAPHIKPDVESAPPTAELRRVLCMAAQDMLTSYLRKHRTRRLLGRAGSYPQSTSVNAVVDTVLAKILAETEKTSELHTLVDEPNDIVVSEVEESFQKNGQYSALCKLYAKVSDEEKLLEAWSKLADGIWSDEDIKDPALRMSELLKRTSNRALIQRWGLWLVRKDSDAGLSLLISRDSKRASKDDERALLEKISDADELAGGKYLEHLVLQKRSQDPILHNRLAQVYLDRLLKCLSDEPTIKLWRAKASSYAKSTNETPFLTYFASTTPDSEARNSRIKAALFLQGSTLYDVTQAIDHLQEQRKSLGFELAILYGKVGRHEDAISTLIRDVHDPTSAEAYCTLGGDVIPSKVAWAIGERCGLQPWAALVTGGAPSMSKGPSSSTASGKAKAVNEDTRRDLLKVLLRVYMTGGNSFTINRTSRLLNAQSVNLDVADVVADVPPEWPLRAMSSFLARAFRRTTHAACEGKIVKAISAGENLEVVENAWVVTREQGAIVEEAGDEDDDDDDEDDDAGDEKEHVLDEKAGLGSVPSSVAEIRINEPKVNGVDGVLSSTQTDPGLDLR